jgi:hypothetical protein
MSHSSYEKAQRFRETGQYPSRSEKRSAFLGHTSDLEVIMPFYNVGCYRRRWEVQICVLLPILLLRG